MGTYINPGNDGFARIVSDEYVDKTGLIGLVNGVIGTPRNLVCVTRPRRFGKSFAAESLVAYYCHGCDSSPLFEGLEISRAECYAKHLNAYNVVKLDMTEFRKSPDAVAELTGLLLGELREMLPDAGRRQEGSVTELTAAILDVAQATGRKFVFVIDEWDAPLREARSEASKEDWVFFLRQLFKNASFTARAVAAAYMTGILPLKRYSTQSALSDFREFTILRPFRYAPYVGFTEEEVETLAERHGMSMDDLRQWYDGYDLPGAGHVYAPFSVMQACMNGEVGSYWTSSETFESLRLYIDMDLAGLRQAVVQLLGGASVPVRTGKFDNDMHDVANLDGMLTLLAHLGYLAYDSEAATVRVPNEEVRDELRNAASESRHAEVARIVRESDLLLQATWDGDADAVAGAIGRIHDDYTAPLYYSDEQALRAVVKAAYISAADHYARVEELPGGRGFADVAYLPKRGSAAPAMVVELKWNQPSEAAIEQIRDRNYPKPLQDLDEPILLVGITYDPKARTHACTIEEA